MYKELDPVLHSPLRLAIVTLLMGVEEAEFNYLLEKTGSTKGNLSVQLQKLKEVGYVELKKSFRGNYPLTTCRISGYGIAAFERYVEVLKRYVLRNG